MFTRWLRRVAIGATAITLAAGLASQPASANAGHYGTDPYGTGCSGNSFLYTSRAVQDEYGRTLTWVRVYYSRSCGTNWITVDSNPAGGHSIKTIWTDNHPQLTEDDYGYGWSYSMQVYAPLNVCIHFQVHLYYPSGASYGETYDPGANYQTVC